MVPENEMREQFSVKSDIFSFGVLAIEIVSGRKRADFTQSQDAPDLLRRVSNLISYRFQFLNTNAQFITDLFSNGE